MLRPRAEQAEQADANESATQRFDDVLTTEATFDVAGFGEITAITTHLTGALLGKALRLSNSAWPGYSGGTSAIVIDAFSPAVHRLSGAAPALIVRTVEDGRCCAAGRVAPAGPTNLR